MILFQPMKYLYLIFIFAVAASAQNRVKLATLEWPPFSSKNLDGNGLVLKKIENAFKNIYIETSFDYFPWTRALRITQAGEYDGLSPEYHSVEREKDFWFSEPIMSSPLVLVTREDFNLKEYTSIQELYPYKIGVVRGYVNTSAIDEDSNIRKDTVADDLANIRKLIAGRIQLIVIDQNVLNYLTKEHSISEPLRVLSPILENKELYLTFPKSKKDSSQLRDKFNEGLRKLKTNDLISHP